MNCRVDIRENIKHYQDTLSYKSSKVDYSVGESIFMIPSDMNLKIRSGAAGYNNKILISDGKFNLRKNDEVNLAVPAMKSQKTNSLETSAIKSHKTNSIEPTTITAAQGLTHTPAISQKNQKPQTITHNEEKMALPGGFAIWNMFR